MAQQHPRPAGSRPANRPAPEVYRRRRIAVLALLVLAAGLIVWGVVALAGLFGGAEEPGQAGPSPQAAASGDPGTDPGTGLQDAEGGETPAEPSADPSEDPAADPSSAGPEETEEADPGACGPGDIMVEASTDKEQYGAGDQPVLVMGISNMGEEPCTVNVGTSQQEFTVVSGSDRIFSTTDCLADPSDFDLTINPGATETARFTWERIRSAPSCQTVTAKPRPGTYVFTARLGEATSNKVPFTLD